MGFISHKVLSVTHGKIKETVKNRLFENELQRNTGSLLLTGCSPAEPVSSSTSWLQR
jgi:hypothetical protein